MPHSSLQLSTPCTAATETNTGKALHHKKKTSFSTISEKQGPDKGFISRRGKNVTFLFVIETPADEFPAAVTN